LTGDGFPEEWRKEMITPIPKKGHTSEKLQRANIAMHGI